MQSVDPQIKQSLARAVKAMQAGDVVKAESICRDFLVANAASVPHLQLLGHALARQDRIAEAKEQIEFALKMDDFFYGRIPEPAPVPAWLDPGL